MEKLFQNMKEQQDRRFAGFPVSFLSTGLANPCKRAADGSRRLHLGICNVIQAVITLKTKTTGTKTGWWSAA